MGNVSVVIDKDPFISAGMIHLSTDANRMLTEIIGGFVTEPRGEVIIKVNLSVFQIHMTF